MVTMKTLSYIPRGQNVPYFRHMSVLTKKIIGLMIMIVLIG